MNIEYLKSELSELVFTQLQAVLTRFPIRSNLRMAHFLAQTDHESGGFKQVEEELNYSAPRLLQIFPRYFDRVHAEMYAHLPVKIANRIYAGRMGNGDEHSGDGYLYRGRGYLQLTGKDNYRLFGDAIGEDLLTFPERVAAEFPMLSSAFFFECNHLWKICDEGNSNRVVEAVTRRVNGGTIGLDERIKKFNHYYGVLLGS